MSIQEDTGSRPASTISRRGPSRAARPTSSLNESHIAHVQAGGPMPARSASRTSVASIPGSFEPEVTVINKEHTTLPEPGDLTNNPTPVTIRRIGSPAAPVTGPSRPLGFLGGAFFTPQPASHGAVSMTPIRPPPTPRVPQITGTITAAGPIPLSNRGTPVVPAPPYPKAIRAPLPPAQPPSSSSSSSSSSNPTAIEDLDQLDNLHLGRHNATLRIIEGLRVSFDRRLTGLEEATMVLANNQQVFNQSLNGMQETLTQILNAARNSENNSFLVGQDIQRLNNDTRNTQGLIQGVQRDVEAARTGQVAWNEALNRGIDETRTQVEAAVTRIQEVETAVGNLREELDEAGQHTSIEVGSGRTISPPGPPEAESTGLEERLVELERRLENQNQQNPRRPKVTRPEAFNGKKGEGAEMFITQMESYFVRLWDQYSSHSERIRESLANFKSENRSATHWAQVLLRALNGNKANEHLSSWNAFKDHFMEQFSDPNEKAKAEANIRKCKQSTSVANYASDFRYLLVDVNWGKEALIHQFKEGLKPEVKRELARFELTLIDDQGEERELSLDRWISVATSIDQKLQAIKGTTGTTSVTTKGATTKRLSDDVYNARKTSGRCLKCGSDKHRLATCKEKEWKQDEPVKGREGVVTETPELGKV